MRRGVLVVLIALLTVLAAAPASSPAAGRGLRTTVQVPVGPSPLAVASRGRFAYVTSAPQNGQPGSLVFVDLHRPKTVAQVTVGQDPIAVALDPGGRFAFVANHAQQGSVSVVDLRRRRVVRTLPAGMDPVDLAVARVGGHKLLLVANQGQASPAQGSIDVWNLRTMQRIAHVDVNFTPLAIAVLTTGHRALIGDGNDGFASVLDLRQLRIVNQVTIPAGPVNDLRVGRRLVYVAAAGGISVLSQSTLAPVGGVVNPPPGLMPVTDAVSPADTGYVVDANFQETNLGALQIVSGPKTVASVPLSSSPVGVALTTNSRDALVTDFNDGTLWIVPVSHHRPFWSPH